MEEQSEELVLKPCTDIVEGALQKDILEYYGVPMSLDKVIMKERKSFLDSLGQGLAFTSEIKHVSSEGHFRVEIPPELREAFRKGDASFIDSVKTPGHYSPNLKIKGKNGIGGQITISEEKISEANIANIAVLAMVQSVLGKLELIESKVDEIVQQLRDNSIGLVIGAFKGFADLYHSFRTKDELIQAANLAYQTMQTGLAQIHLDLDRDRSLLENAPATYWQVIKNAASHLRRNDAEYYQKIYTSFIYKLQLYQRLLLLSDAILLVRGVDLSFVRQNHKFIVSYCDDKLGPSFVEKMSFLTAHEPEEIKQVKSNNEKYDKALKEMDNVPILVELTKEEIKYLENNDEPQVS